MACGVRQARGAKHGGKVDPGDGFPGLLKCVHICLAEFACAELFSADRKPNAQPNVVQPTWHPPSGPTSPLAAGCFDPWLRAAPARRR
ncbi:hypothetical protein GCM10017772_29300 [Promicromonospora soli]|uniref:Uncharacterized protein n=1 Tax=Promicromonospora soli TaxID=2035533 RepID=A0A919FZF0_9MICO|nr:hypothetical protein GCM10017772_29300 [Promicromonospora soli]